MLLVEWAEVASKAHSEAAHTASSPGARMEQQFLQALEQLEQQEAIPLVAESALGLKQLPEGTMVKALRLDIVLQVFPLAKAAVLEIAKLVLKAYTMATGRAAALQVLS